MSFLKLVRCVVVKPHHERREERMVGVEGIGNPVLVLGPCPHGKKTVFSVSRAPRAVYVRFEGTPIRSTIRRSLSRTGAGGCAEAFLTSSFQSESRLFGMSMRTRDSFVSSACGASRNQVP